MVLVGGGALLGACPTGPGVRRSSIGSMDYWSWCEEELY